MPQDHKEPLANVQGSKFSDQTSTLNKEPTKHGVIQSFFETADN